MKFDKYLNRLLVGVIIFSCKNFHGWGDSEVIRREEFDEALRGRLCHERTT